MRKIILLSKLSEILCFFRSYIDEYYCNYGMPLKLSEYQNFS